MDSNARAPASLVAEAARALANGRLVILPTETVYGLACAAGDPSAVAALYAAKARPAFNPMIAHVRDTSAATRVGRLDARAMALARAFWPGPLTIVAPVGEERLVCDLARAGLDTIAIRVPAHPVARSVIEAFGAAIVAPSANRSGRPSPTTLADAMAETGEAAAVAIDGGPCAIGLESTVVSLLDGPPRLLRPGAVTRAALEAVVGSVAEARDDARRSPGRLARHYAPASPLRLDATAPLAGEVFLAFGAYAEGSCVLNLSPSGDMTEAATHLFAFLRAADLRAPTAIAVATIPDVGLGEAINDRLRRAAGWVG